MTLHDRNAWQMHESLVVVYGTGDGDYYALDTSRTNADGESPLVLWLPNVSIPTADRPEVARDFGQFFYQTVKEAVETLADEQFPGQ